MNIDTLVDYVVIKGTQILKYNEKIEIIEHILQMQETLPKVPNFEVTALGLQSLSDKTLVITYYDTLFLNAVQFFTELQN
jgi:hypothetical protein